MAASGPDDFSVTEPDIAAGPNLAITAFFDSPLVGRYAAFNVSAGTWTEGVIPGGGFNHIVDLSIAYDGTTSGEYAGDFVAASLGRSGSYGHILTCRYHYNPDDPNGLGDFDANGWVSRASRYGSFYPVDKPWIVAGEILTRNQEAFQEYYIVYMDNNGSGFADGYAYLRSIDGGNCWAGEPIKLAGTGERIEGKWCAQPTVCGNGTLYIAYMMNDGRRIRFLAGEDIDGDPGNPNYDPTDPNYVGVSFTRLYGVTELLDGPMPPVPLTVPLNRSAGSYGRCLPGNFKSQVLPQLTVDPTDPNRIYLVYQDTASNNPNDPDFRDVNIYLRVLTKGLSTWTAGPRLKVNNDNTPFESDQFMPSVAVDGSGYIHVIFYDDRNYTFDPGDPTHDQQEDDQTDPPPKFDVFYAWSINQGQNWVNEELRAPEGKEEPAIDFQYNAAYLREYIGITWYGNEQQSKVWTAFNGTSQFESNNKGVVWSSLIDW